jgi:hypothetical protein
MLWKLIIMVLKVFLFFCLLWRSLVVRFGDDVAKGSPMQESMSSGHGIMHHVQGSTHKNTQDLQTHLFPGIA